MGLLGDARPEARAGRATTGCSLWCGLGHDHSAGLRGDLCDRTHCPLLAYEIAAVFVSSREEEPTFRC
jgi:hypothetical protein